MTILFDFDGTLADTLGITIKLFNKVATDYKLPHIPHADIEILKNLSAKELLKKYPLSPWKLLKLVKHIQDELKKNMKEVEVFVGLAEVLKDLSKNSHQIGIVTTNSEENVNLFLESHNLKGIDFVYSEKSLFGKGKVLKKLIQKNHLNKNDVIYVGDEVRDIEAARSAGISVVAVTWGFNSKERLMKANPNFMVSRPDELRKVLLQSNNAHPLQNPNLR